ncbi:MAG: DUF169 domain-containing protein [Oscillospiraceae bacterium]
MLDFEVFKGFNFEYPPVGVKFSMTKPGDLPLLTKKHAICEMLREAQLSEGGFYAAYDNHNCKVGPYILGQIGREPGIVGGQIGPRLGVYQDARANRQIYLDMPRLDEGTGSYTWFSKLDGISFDPDIIILTAKPSQAEIVLRAKGYRSGKGWNARGTSVAGCASLYTYPYLSGDMNMMVTGLHHGMKVREIFPEGLLFLSIPFQLIPEIISNLKEMQWNLPQYSWGREQHLKRMKEIGQEIAAEMKNN